jgi:hypothetical protein
MGRAKNALHNIGCRIVQIVFRKARMFPYLSTRWRSPWADSAMRSSPVTSAGHGNCEKPANYGFIEVDDKAKLTLMLVVFGLNEYMGAIVRIRSDVT